MLLNELRIREELYKRRLSQTWLAHETGYTRACISNVCNGKSCSGDTAIAIANALNLSLTELLRQNN